MSDAESIQSALRRADLWRILALLFGEPGGRGLDDLRAVCADLADTLRRDGHPLADGTADLAMALTHTDPRAFEHERNALFSLDVVVPAYEGSYQRVERGAVVGDVAAYYAAFGLVPAEQSGPPDSLWDELAFLSWLALQEAHALEQGTEEQRDIVRDATRTFLQDHLGRWVGVFSRRLLAVSGHPALVAGTHLLLAVTSLAADESGVKEIHPLSENEAPPEGGALSCPAACQPDP